MTESLKQVPDQDSWEVQQLQWQLHTKVGNQLMQATQPWQARSSYEQALDIAICLVDRAKTAGQPRDSIHLYVISCHNLADSLLSSGQVQSAEQTLHQGFDQVVETMLDETLPGPLREESFRALRNVALQMNHFYRQCHQVDRAEEVMDKAATVAQGFLDLHTKFWHAAKLCSACKVEVSLQHANELMDAIREIQEMFWATKNRTDVPWYRAS